MMFSSSNFDPTQKRPVLEENNVFVVRNQSRDHIKFNPIPFVPVVEPKPRSRPLYGDKHGTWVIHDDDHAIKDELGQWTLSEMEKTGQVFHLPRPHPHNDVNGTLEKIRIPVGNHGEMSLDVPLLARLFIQEIKRTGLSQRAMANKMDLNSGLFSTYFVCRVKKSFSSCGHTQKIAAYQAFTWLNLPFRERLEVFYPNTNPEEQEEEVSRVPKLFVLLPLVRKEMRANGLTARHLAESIVNEPVEVVEDLLNMEHMPWPLMPRRMRKFYDDLWWWMQQTGNNRLEMIKLFKKEVATEHSPAFPDVPGLCKCALNLLFSSEKTLNFVDFSQKVLGINEEWARFFLSYPKEWTECNDTEKSVYINLLRWLNLRSSEKFSKFNIVSDTDVAVAVAEDQEISYFKNNNQLETQVVAENVLYEIKKGSATIKGFAESLNINRNYFSTLMRSPILWPNATKLQRRVYTVCHRWLKCSETERYHLSDNKKPEVKLNSEQNESEEEEENRRPIILPSTTTSATSSSRSLETNRQPRFKFSSYQISKLKESFSRNSRPTTEEKRIIALQIGVPVHTVSIFYCNRRRKMLNLTV